MMMIISMLAAIYIICIIGVVYEIDGGQEKMMDIQHCVHEFKIKALSFLKIKANYNYNIQQQIKFFFHIDEKRNR